MENLNVIFQYILAILGFSLIILVHEFGHFLFAKISGVHVEEFFIGFGPKLLKFKSRSGTTYGISAIPIGGYNKILGLERNEKIPEDKKNKAFNTKPFHKKMMIIIGGVSMNAVLTVILIGIFLSMGAFAITNSIEYVQPGSPAEIYGFEVGDEVVALNEEKIESWEEFASLTKSHPGEIVIYNVIRDGKEIKIKTELDNVNGEGFLGISPAVVKKEMSFFGIVKESFVMTWEISKSYAKLFFMLFSGKLSFTEARPVSPIGVVSIFQQSASMGLQNFILFVALVSLMLTFGNLIPILPLDGGHIVVLLIEAVRRKSVSEKFLEIYSKIGIAIIICLMAVGFIFDIISPFNLQNM
jgi:regulator of sigma E protease